MPPPARSISAGMLAQIDAGIDLVEAVDLDVDVRAEHILRRKGWTISADARERIGRDAGAKPADRIAVVAVVRKPSPAKGKSASDFPFWQAYAHPPRS